MVVRKFRPSMRRLYEDPARDIITQQILNEDFAEKLVAQFILRLGHGIQVKSVGDLTTTPSIRQASPLLYAVCCLQALRFFKDTNAVDPNDHRQLYEEVRRMLGQVVLASPLPVEELYAILIMCIYEAAPKPVFEYIESWHLSGICAQQAISTIDFAEILSRLSLGKHEARDKTYLSLWNNICLVNLRFAVGTGKPATIPHDLLEHCPAILNHPQATIDDGIVLAEIMLFSALCDKTAPPSLNRHGHCQALMAWEKRWAHLLASEKAIHLRFGREFAYLVLAMRAVEKYGSSRTGQSTFQVKNSSQYDLSENVDDGDHSDSHLSFHSSRTCAHKHALAMAGIFLEMPTTLVEELPKFHQICIAYCCIVLSGCITDKSASPRQVLDILGDVCAHYRRFSDELPAVMNVALEKMGLEVGENTSGKRDGQSQGSCGLKGDSTDVGGSEIPNDGLASPLTHTSQSHLISGPGNATGADQLDTDWFDHELGLLSFPTVDDFFESWTVQYSA
ncbi:hypothetical protein DL546_008695 [Coniochaeta pulveracea]|nr:hypothetical protein DL546_008695 [Coniochaeta pulveracea]